MSVSLGDLIRWGTKASGAGDEQLWEWLCDSSPSLSRTMAVDAEMVWRGLLPRDGGGGPWWPGGSLGQARRNAFWMREHERAERRMEWLLREADRLGIELAPQPLGAYSVPSSPDEEA